ncbi:MULTISPECIES: O-antigen polysaccharide polymerase Wzy [unclassified Campylobacter]|uniref:O-antigen polysaccharide polymerase Wzy n=1 Tax=unclassified Campylobacter TaxID=2593542 RepID=UPI0022E9D0DD|nr:MULTISPECIES: O-antigen polysaccharide polymerase Wzy [unclassified Campylobacter]MDA3055413.1 O-antigen polysaccharide polymerase Wzy family protein [Campylobacter sp. CN_NA1]MDA3064897.1 O-antigen polysaccharide polymerase Wzy family protein [Campylobacter sp. CN_NE4]MDA3068279.1 O-antigen polysaccharide polymerase Wzy family protein [Campylobacter sp. CN_NE3]MDA3082408.1 O-antigen polysaccharide polymerase Wzy family protein [Campylobacter sp. CN_EL2]MDA3084043.1 O-antigen polysaccharide
MSNKKYIVLFLLIDFIFMFFIMSQYLLDIGYSKTYFKILEFQNIFLSLYAIATIYKINKNWFSLEILFIGCFNIFLNMRNILNFFFPDIYEAYEESYRLANFIFSDNTFLELNFILLFTMLSIHIGMMLGFAKYNKFINTSIPKANYIFNLKLGYIMFFIGLFAYLVKTVINIKIILSMGYEAIYTTNAVPSIISMLDNFFLLGFIFIMINKIEKRKGKIFFLIFVLISLISLASGARATFFLYLLSALWLYTTVYSYKIKFKTLLVLVFSLFLLASMVQFIRHADTDNITFAEVFKIFYSQGITILVVGFVVEFKDYFTTSINQHTGFLLSPFFGLLDVMSGNIMKQDMRLEVAHPHLADVLSYFLFPEKFLEGHGLGGSFVAEIWLFGGGSMISVVFFSLILGFFISFVQNKLIYTKYGLFVAANIVMYILFANRNNYLTIFTFFVMMFCFVLLLRILFSILNSLEIISKKSQRK